MQKQLKAIDKELGKTRLDFINVRNIIFGKVKGKKLDQKDSFYFSTIVLPVDF